MNYTEKYLKGHLNCNRSVEALFKAADEEITQHWDTNKQFLSDTQIFLDKIDKIGNIKQNLLELANKEITAGYVFCAKKKEINVIPAKVIFDFANAIN